MPTVKLYTTPSCPYCRVLKDFFQEHNVAFEEIDVAQDEKARDYMIEKTNQMGVPVVEIGDEFVVGFDKVKIVKLLNIQE